MLNRETEKRRHPYDEPSYQDLTGFADLLSRYESDLFDQEPEAMRSLTMYRLAWDVYSRAVQRWTYRTVSRSGKGGLFSSQPSSSTIEIYQKPGGTFIPVFDIAFGPISFLHRGRDKQIEALGIVHDKLIALSGNTKKTAKGMLTVSNFRRSDPVVTLTRSEPNDVYNKPPSGTHSSHLHQRIMVHRKGCTWTTVNRPRIRPDKNPYAHGTEKGTFSEYYLQNTVQYGFDGRTVVPQSLCVAASKRLVSLHQPFAYPAYVMNFAPQKIAKPELEARYKYRGNYWTQESLNTANPKALTDFPYLADKNYKFINVLFYRDRLAIHLPYFESFRDLIEQLSNLSGATARRSY